MNFGEFIVYYVMGPVVFVVGMVGNLTALLVFFKGKLKNIGPVLIYKLLFISDAWYLLQIVLIYLQFPLNLYFQNLSSLACKLYNYFYGQADAISPFLLVYISIEKFISIGYLTKRRILTRNRNQIIYFSFVFLYCSGYSIVHPFCFDLINLESSNQTFSSMNETNRSSSDNDISYMYCNFVSHEAQNISSILDLINRQLIPSFLMICFSCLLVSVIFKSRSRVASSTRQQNRIDRDVKLAFNCFVMNFIFFACNTPVSIASLIPNVLFSDIFLFSTQYVFLISYGVNFYILLGCNSLNHIQHRLSTLK